MIGPTLERPATTKGQNKLLLKNKTSRDKAWDGAIERVKFLLVDRLEAKMEIAKLAYSVCDVQYRSTGRYSLMRFARESGMPSSTLYNWIQALSTYERLSKTEKKSATFGKLISNFGRSGAIKRQASKNKHFAPVANYLLYLTTILNKTKDVDFMRKTNAQALREIKNLCAEIILNITDSKN